MPWIFQTYLNVIERLFTARLIILGFCAAAAAANATDNLSSAEKASGWKMLFDGTTFQGWQGSRSQAPASGWTIADGALTRTGDAGDLVTVGEFGDFELSLEWKIGVRINSGIIYRVGINGSSTFETGPEYQILDDEHIRESPTHLTGALYDLVAPSKNASYPVGEWNATRIVVRGWKIEHWLNGEKIIDCDLASPEGKLLISRSKFATMPGFATFRRGHIALQDHGGYVSFRHIKIRELD
jgi:hypothetical protein